MATQAKVAKPDGKNNHEAGSEQAGKNYLYILEYTKIIFKPFPVASVREIFLHN